ncbi:hypothetical protein EON76_06055 [bacterium]|nr:MAG: hypothetical protein EON76_06055 [bacterium]
MSITPLLRPAVNSDIAQILDTPSRLHEAFVTYKRPLSISMIKSAINVVAEFESLFHELNIEGRVYIAHKATSDRYAIRSLQPYARIDVASVWELHSAQRAGFSMDRIIATGPKADYFLEALLKAGVTIAIDSTEELLRIQTLLQSESSRRKECTILLRLSRSILNMPSVTRGSRFGLDRAAVDRVTSLLASDDRFNLRGVSFHLDTQSIQERRYASQVAIDELLRLQSIGFCQATVLDVGGGFGTDYGVTAADKDHFAISLQKAIKSNASQRLTWQGYSYGMSKNEGSLTGRIQGIELAHISTGADRLREILLGKGTDGVTIASQLRDNLIELWIEPGSAVLSGSSVLAMQIIEVKDVDGALVIVVDGHRNQVCFDGSEAPCDPLLISSAISDKCSAYIAGHLCVESDLLTYRKVQFDVTPRSGDILLWTHTGAYRSHFSVSQAIGHPLPKKLAYIEQTTGGYVLEENDNDL